MAQVQPFRGFRYDVGQVGDLSDVTCPPYDVIDADFQERLYQKHPCNVIRLELNRDEPGDPNPDEKYRRAAEFLRRWQRQGVLFQEREDALYAYHQIFEWEGIAYTRRGFLGRIRLERFGEGKVFPHEQTMSGPKADRLKLLEACRMNLSPVFGLYPDRENAVQEPLEQAIRAITPLEAKDHLGVVHRMWPVTNRESIERVRKLILDKPVFIADGHHRYETAINYRDGLQAAGQLAGPDAPANFALMMFVGMSDPGLIILPTHRLVSGLAGRKNGDWLPATGEGTPKSGPVRVPVPVFRPDMALTADQVRSALAPNFKVESIGAGPDAARKTWEMIELDGGQGILGLGTTADGQWLLARLTDGSPMRDLAPDQSDDWRGLGVSLLHKLVLDHLLQPHHAAGGPTCRYVHQLDEVLAAQAAHECPLACLVPPAQIEHVEKIAERLEKMPPKSTYFYPKLQTGLVFNSL